MTNTKIYIAAPLFTFGERTQNMVLGDALVKLGYEVYLPQYLDIEGRTGAFVSSKLRSAINEADVIVACMDAEDNGTAWEMGYAFDKCLIISYYTNVKFEPIGGIDSPFNCMNYYGSDRVIDARALDIDELAAAISDAIESGLDKWGAGGRA